MVLAFISSRIPVGDIPLASVVLDVSHPDFDMSGLKTSSVIRLDKVATVLSSLILGELGVAGPQVRETVNQVISEIYRM